MSMVRARVNANVHEWRRGDVITVERTRMVDGLITRQYLTVLEADVPDFAPDSPEGLEAARIVAERDCRNGHHSWSDSGAGPCTVCGAPPTPYVAPTDPEASENPPVAAGDVQNWTDDQPPIRPTYRRSENGGGTTDFGDPLPASVAVPPDVLAALTPTAGAAAARAELTADTVAVPPRSGKGSGVAVWREFLQGQGIDTLPDGMTGTKEDLLALWDAEVKRRGL